MPRPRAIQKFNHNNNTNRKAAKRKSIYYNI